MFYSSNVSVLVDRGKAQGITIAAARYSSEDAAVLVEYTVALMEYTNLYKPYSKALNYLEELIQEKEEDEKRSEIETLRQEEEKETVRLLFSALIAQSFCSMGPVANRAAPVSLLDIRRILFQNACIAKLTTLGTVLDFLSLNSCGALDHKSR